MSKIKLLVIPSDTQGVGHFRSIWPAQAIDRRYNDKISVEINSFPNFNDKEYFKKFDIVHFHRQLGDINDTPKNIEMLKSLGLKVVMDLDDYWQPFGQHPLYYIINREGVGEKIKNLFPLVDHVTTTTEIFREKILPYNKNVTVMPNTVYDNHKMWRGKDKKPEGSEKVRIAWIGGSSHKADLDLIKNSMNLLNSDKELKGKYQIMLAGFDVRGNLTQVDESTGEKHVRKITPDESIWKRFEEIFTSNYLLTENDEEYTEFLNKIEKKPYKNEYYQNYVRRWTLPLTQYGKHYDYCDICLAPLCDIDTIRKSNGQIIKQKNLFNEAKSELKLIESGVKKKALIAQDFGIYSDLIKDGENGILIPTNKNAKGWYKAIKKLILDKEYREKLADNLNVFIKDNYNIDKLTKERVEFYERINF